MMIEVGEYVRLRNGKIIKFKRFGKLNIHNVVRNQNLHKNIHINEHGIASIKTIIGENSRHYSYDNIVKHSKNIIDLIEVGDYVNGVRVINILDKDEEKIPTSVRCINNCFYKKDIKSIVTKEQFAAIEYKVGD